MQEKRKAEHPRLTTRVTSSPKKSCFLLSAIVFRQSNPLADRDQQKTALDNGLKRAKAEALGLAARVLS